MIELISKREFRIISYKTNLFVELKEYTLEFPDFNLIPLKSSFIIGYTVKLKKRFYVKKFNPNLCIVSNKKKIEINSDPIKVIHSFNDNNVFVEKHEFKDNTKLYLFFASSYIQYRYD